MLTYSGNNGLKDTFKSGLQQQQKMYIKIQMACTLSNPKIFPEEIKLPLLAILNWLFPSSVTSLETIGAPVSVKSIAISSKLLAEGIFA